MYSSWKENAADEQQGLQNKSTSFINFNISMCMWAMENMRPGIPGELCHDLLDVGAVCGAALMKQRLVLLHKPQS